MRRGALASRCRELALRRAPRLFARFARPSTEELGRLGEELAARALARRGWRIVGRRLRTPWGEVDVVAWDAGELVCVEVKTGRLPGADLRFRPGLRVDRERLARLAGAGRWLARRLPRPPALAPRATAGGRVDLVEVVLRGAPPRVELHHHPRLEEPLEELRTETPRYP